MLRLPQKPSTDSSFAAIYCSTRVNPEVLNYFSLGAERAPLCTTPPPPTESRGSSGRVNTGNQKGTSAGHWSFTGEHKTLSNKPSRVSLSKQSWLKADANGGS